MRLINRINPGRLSLSRVHLMANLTHEENYDDGHTREREKGARRGRDTVSRCQPRLTFFARIVMGREGM